MHHNSLNITDIYFLLELCSGLLTISGFTNMSSSMFICRRPSIICQNKPPRAQILCYFQFHFFSKITLYVKSCSAGSYFASPEKLQHKHSLNLEQERNSLVMFEVL